MAPRLRTGLRILALLIALALVAAGLGLVPLNLFFLKDTLAEQLREQAGVELAIAGPLRARLGPRPAIEATALTAALPGAGQPSFAEIDRLTVRPRLFDILRGRYHFRSIRIDGAGLDYCPDAWPRPAAADDGAPFDSLPLAVDSLELTGLRLRCDKPEQALRFVPERLDLEAKAPRGRPLSLEAGGAHPGGDVRLALEGGQLSDLLAGTEPWAFTAALQALSGDLAVDGRLGQPLSAPRLDADIELTVADPGLALGFFDVDTAPIGALQLAGRIEVGPAGLRLDGVEGTVGDTGFAVSGTVADLRGRPRFDVTGRLDQLDLGPTADPAEPAAPADHTGGTTGDEALVGDLGPLLDFLDSVDGRLALRVGRISGLPVELTGLAIEGRVENGQAQVDEARLAVGDGALAARASLDIRAECPALALRAELHGLDLSVLSAWADSHAPVDGKVGRAVVDASSCGRSLAALRDALRLAASVEDVEATHGGEAIPGTISRLDVEAAWLQRGRTTMEGSLLGERLRVEAEHGSIDAILGGESEPLAITAGGAGAALEFEGKAAFTDGAALVEGSVDLTAGRVGELHRWLGVPQANEMALSYRSGLRIDGTAVRLDRVAARLGNSDARGEVSWSADGPVVLRLAADRLDAPELARLLGVEDGGRARPQSAEAGDAGADRPWTDRLAFAALDIDLKIATLTGHRYEFGDIELRARLRDRLIEDGRLTVEMGERTADVDFDLDFRTTPWRLGGAVDLVKVDIGALLVSLGFETELEVAAERLQLRYRSAGSSPQELLENSSLSGRVEGADWRFQSGPEARRHHLAVDAIEMSAALDMPWTWRASGTLDGVPLRFWLESPSLAAALDVSQPLPLSAVLDSAGSMVKLEAVVSGRGSDTLAADLGISGAWAHPPIDDLSSPDLRLDDYRLHTVLSVSERLLAINDLDLRIGASRMNGQAELRYLDPGYLVRADLASPFLETDDLARAGAEWRAAQPAEQPPEEPSTAAGAQSNGGLIELLNRELDGVIANHRLDISIGVEELHSGGNALGRGRLSARSVGDGFRADLTIGAHGEDITAVYETGTASDSGFSLRAHAKQFEYGGLARLFVPGSELSGQVYLDTELTSPDSDPETFANQLEGHLDMVVFPRNVAADGLDLWASNLVLALLRFGAESSKQLNCGVARFEVADGVMKTRNAFLDTTDIIVRAQGSIDLAGNEIDLWIAPQAKVERFLSISAPLVVTGPLDDFSVGVPPSGFLATMFRWFYGVIYVPWKWLTGERFPADGIATCYRAMDWDLPETAAAEDSR